ncbi:DUF2057 domain-containing protein [Otariodibacter sp.]|uniref:curli polymerization inhibitor CsgI-related protein n=1 Tax=Otariodibacter sp. TaxID=3030919 RepID=UPI0026071617|nr:DUF2057 domain-containing protein [Otariodibacter sp.]
MKLGKIALVATTLVASTAVFASSITSSSNINFLAFDGQKVKKDTALTINDTDQHQVVVEVSSIYDSGSDSSYFESTPIVVTFTGSQENIKIIAPRLRSYLDVEKFKKNPTLEIETISGNKVAYKLDYLKGEGFLPNINVVENLANYNAGNNVASLKQFAMTPMTAMVPMQNSRATKGQVMVQGENIAEQQLQYWFQQADKKTQKRFLDWAKKH